MNRSIAVTAPQGIVFRWALAYDLVLHLLWGRSEDAYRRKIVALAALRSGESVLDVGCGTGTLAIAAKRRVGRSGQVVGIDASSQMIARAHRKASKAGSEVELHVASAASLPLPDATFDAAISTTVLHCLAPQERAPAILEMARVLRPGGRLLLVDFGGSVDSRHSLMSHMKHHRRFDLHEVLPAVREAGLGDIETGAVGFSDLSFALARK